MADEDKDLYKNVNPVTPVDYPSLEGSQPGPIAPNAPPQPPIDLSQSGQLLPGAPSGQLMGPMAQSGQPIGTPPPPNGADYVKPDGTPVYVAKPLPPGQAGLMPTPSEKQQFDQGITSTLADALAARSSVQPGSQPMPTSVYNTKQIEALEAKKIITAQEADILRQHSQRESAIYGGASQEDRASVEQSRLDLLQAQRDANARDEEIRGMIRKQYQEQIDPNKWWGNKSTGEKMLAGVGMLLSGMGGAMSGQQSAAMQVINNAIDRDIDAQKANINKNYEAIMKMHGLNESTFNRELHKQVWENNYRTAALERVKLDLAKNAALTTSEQVKTRAQEGIINLTQEQNKIKNQQWVLDQQHLAAERARIRALEKDADGDIQKLIEKEGVDWDTAARSVLGRPRYRELVDRGMVTSQMAAAEKMDAKSFAQYKVDQKIWQDKIKDVDDMVKRYNLSPERAKELKDRVGPPPAVPKAALPPVGSVVGPDQMKQLNIAGKKEELAGIAGQKASIADIYGQALGYKNFFGKDQPGDVSAKLQSSPVTGWSTALPGTDAHSYQMQISSWNTFVDTTLAPAVERAIQKGKPGQVSLGTAKERFHIDAWMSQEKKNQIMSSALQSLDEAAKVEGVPVDKIQPVAPRNTYAAETPKSSASDTSSAPASTTSTPSYFKPAGK